MAENTNFGMMTGKEISEALHRQHRERLLATTPDGDLSKAKNIWHMAADQFKQEDYLKGESENVRKLFSRFREEFTF